MVRGRSTTRRRGRTSRYLRICLWLSLWVWSAPMPWMHNHDWARAAGANRWLAQHLSQYHRQNGIVQDVRGWHFHLLYARGLGTKPTGKTPDDSSPKNEPPTVRITESTDVRPLLGEGDHELLGPPAMGDLIGPSPTDVEPLSVGGFLRTYPRSVAFSELLGVWRC